MALTNADMRAGVHVCFLCGREGADTVEHVVPRSLYPGPLGDDAITAPAHEACNQTTARAEETFRNHVGLGATERENPVFEAALRSLGRGRAAGLRAEFVRHMQPAERGGGFIGMNADRVLWVLAKIMKGLVYEATGEILKPRDIRWAFAHIGIATLRRMAPPPEPPFARDVPRVLQAFWYSEPETPVLALVRMYGNDEAIYSVTAFPTKRRATWWAAGARALVWPTDNV